MTAVVALVENGQVWMGGDRACIGGQEVVIRARPKIGRVGPYLIGTAGASRVGEIGLSLLGPPDPPKDPDDLDGFMAVNFAEGLYDAHRRGHLDWDEGREGRYDGLYLVGVAGRLFIVFGDYATVQVDSFEAIGSGAQVANGAMYASEGRQARDRILTALAAAARFNTGVRPPFDVEVLE